MLHIEKRIKRVSGVLIFGFMVIFLFLATQVAAETPVETADTVEAADTVEVTDIVEVAGAEDLAQVQGEVVLLTPELISIEFGKEENTIKEILIPLDEETEFTHLLGLDDIQERDTVRVIYKETYKRGSGGKRIDFKRVAVDISLVKRASAGDTLVSVEE
ncbi:hypothetical protein ACFL28_01775 [Candidatus Omnitrophota bacterium]